MATTIRLLSTYNGFKPQSIITVEDAIATQLIAGGVNATTNLTGGVVAYQEAPFIGVAPASEAPSARTLRANQQVVFLVPAGMTVNLTGSSDVAGTREVLALDGSVAISTALQPGAGLTAGPYQVDTSVRLKVSAGTLSTKVVPLSSSGAGGGSGAELGPPVTIPYTATTFTLRGAGNGGMGDTITAIRYRTKGAATTVTLTDGDGTPYPDPSGNPGVIPNPYSAKQILGPNAVNPADLLMYGQPSYSGAWNGTKGVDVEIDFFGNFS